MRISTTNALDLRADHPKLLRDYTTISQHPVAYRAASALRRVFLPNSRLKPVAAQ